MLRELTEINGVSGDEGRVRKYIKEKITPLCDEITVDSMGNVIALKRGAGETRHKIMLCAHMDEVGFIVSDITADGFVKFKPVGGIDKRILLTQRVVIDDVRGRVNGVIGIKAVHLQTADERKKVVPMDNLYVDIGANDRTDALKYVEKGDYISFNSDYTEFGDGCIKAKALDDRAGCATLIRLMQGTYESDLYFCFNTQEEVGLRGARIVAHRLGADIAFVLESTTAADMPFVDDCMRCTVQGEGPVISLLDRASCSDKYMNSFVIERAKKHGIKYQLKKTINGGNDAGAIQTSANAVRTCAVSLPCRYIHSPVSTVKKSDIEDMYNLMKCVLEDINDFGAEE